MFTIDVRIDVKPALDRLNAVKAGLGDRAVGSALNKTMASAKVQMARAITQEYNLPSAFVKDRLPLLKASRAGGNYTAAMVGNPAGSLKRSLN